MDKTNIRIVFMGTPEFAVGSLSALVENGYNVVGVITMPDKPAGRGHKLQASAVKEYALQQNLPLLQPEKLKDDFFLQQLSAWHADLQVVVAFRMLPEAVWSMPRLGTFNLHASLLPQYRGAAPINHAIINGEKETGATTFFLTHEIDTGNIIKQIRIPVRETDTAGSIHDELMKKGAQLVMDTVDMISEGHIETVPQEQFAIEESKLKPAPKIFRETCRIDWMKPATDIFNFIRGLSPYPSAWTELVYPNAEPVQIKVCSSEKIAGTSELPAGSILTDNKTFLNTVCTDGLIRITELQLPSKKRMKTGELLRGFKFGENACFK